MEKFNFNKDSDSLFRAILGLKDKRETEKFFRDLCTAQELADMVERWRIARLLGDGLSYRQVSAETGASTTTVGRVASWLANGKGGYKIALDRLSKKHHSSQG